jgi:hypothetical protein
MTCLTCRGTGKVREPVSQYGLRDEERPCPTCSPVLSLFGIPPMKLKDGKAVPFWPRPGAVVEPENWYLALGLWAERYAVPALRKPWRCVECGARAEERWGRVCSTNTDECCVWEFDVREALDSLPREKP